MRIEVIFYLTGKKNCYFSQDHWHVDDIGFNSLELHHGPQPAIILSNAIEINV